MSEAAGEYNTRVYIQERSGARDGANQLLDDWGNVMERWAKPRGQTGMGVIRGSVDGVQVSANMYSFRIRYAAQITAARVNTGMRLVEARTGTVFDIQSVSHDLDRREWTDLVCMSGASNG